MATANDIRELKELKKEVRHLSEIVQDVTHDATSRNGSNIFGVDGETVRDFARETGKSLRGYLRNKSKQAVQFRDTCEETISTRPFTSVAVAVAGGMLLGALLNRK